MIGLSPFGLFSFGVAGFPGIGVPIFRRSLYRAAGRRGVA